MTHDCSHLRSVVSPAAIGVGDHAATIGNRPGSVPIPVVTAIIAVIVIVSGKAKETKRRSVEIRVSIIRVVRIVGGRIHVVWIRIRRRSLISGPLLGLLHFL